MRLPTSNTGVNVPPHIQAIADQLMIDAQARFGHGVWTMNSDDPPADPPADPPNDPPADPPSDPLGFPANTPLTEMTEGQQAAYWRNESKKHQGRLTNLTGGRSFDETKADLDAYAEVKKAQQTPAEQALADAREQGKREALTTSTTKAATAILTVALKARGVEGDDLTETLDIVDVTKFIGDDGDIDTDRLTAAANRFGSAPGPGTGTGGRRHRDFGGGSRGGSGGGGKSRGELEAERRFGAKQ